MNVVRYKSKDGRTMIAVIVKVGRKWAHLVWLDFPIRLKKVRVSELEYTEPMSNDLTETCEAMLDAGHRMGITKGAKDALTGIVEAHRRVAA